MYRVALASLLAVTITGQVAAQASAMPADPWVWLEDKDGPQAMEWVAAENAKTLPRLETDVWVEPVSVGQPLPTLPLRVIYDVYVPVEFETVYWETLRSHRLPR